MDRRFPPRHVDVYLLRAEGLFYREIGHRLGMSATRARQIDHLAENRIARYARQLRFKKERR